MASIATISPTTVGVQPGGEADCELRVRNTGHVVDQFSFQALGDAASWVTFEPSSVSLFPDAEGATRIIFRPPRGPGCPAGAYPVGVRVISKEDPSSSLVEEFTLDIGELADVFAELIPRTSRGRRQAIHHIAVDNRGNARLNAGLDASDPDDHLSFSFDPPAVAAEPGTAAFSRLLVRPVRRLLRGPDVTRPFQVLVEAENQPPLKIDGTMLQQALIPRWAPRALAGMVAAIIALVVLWAALLRPSIRSAAKEAVSDPLNAQQTAVADQGNRLSKLEEKVTGTTVPASTVSTVSALGNPYGERLAVSTKGRDGTDTKDFPIAEKQTFSLTDILLQNPAGDTGFIEVRRGDDVILRVNLANFRDLDYHFVSPIVFQAGERAVLSVQCANPEGGTGCTPAAYFTGFIKQS